MGMGEGVAMPMNNIISILGGKLNGTVIVSRAPVRALKIGHFCHTWGTIIIRIWVPTYYNQVLKFHLMEFGLVAVLPWLTVAPLFAYVGGWTADTLVARGFAITSVRKIMQSMEGLGPVFLLSLLRQMKPLVLAVLSMPFLQGLDAFSQSGLYSNHQDIGPRYLSSKSSVVAPVKLLSCPLSGWDADVLLCRDEAHVLLMLKQQELMHYTFADLLLRFLC
ncbi:hypothetical protein Nepgr_023658 [Nepenthes gracilis]|uniref:Uncharacterized protein n=1 Tax=Nepenthes gracilis TaxID=150966 RepID=A0AAD3T1S8_NEPGR|nr:hypothetical protein Nepgr_023658 [Nepenthes gracilis]